MASVKFNRGLLNASGQNQDDSLAFLAKNSTLYDAKDFGYLYLGTHLVATKYIDALDASQLATQPTATNPRILTVELSGANPIVTSRKMVLAAEVSAASPVYSPSDSDILSAAATGALISSTVGSLDKYHTAGSWGSSTSWNQYTFTSHNFSGTDGDITITLPVTSSFSNTDDTHLVTPKTIADYFAGLEGGMRYCGAVSSTTLPTGTGTMAPYKQGDTFIASAAFIIGTAGSGSEKNVEIGDMVIIKSGTNVTTLTTSNCDVFERNLDGSVTTSGLTANGVVYATGTNSVSSLASGTAGQILSTGSQNSSPQWVDYVYYMTRLRGGTSDTIQIVQFLNGSEQPNPTEIQIKSEYVKQTSTSANELRPILVAASTSPTSGAAAQIHYESQVKINPSAANAELSITRTGTGGTTVNVYDALTWHVITNSGT